MTTTATGAASGSNKKLVLAAMIFAVAMTFIDQTIVSIAVPKIQTELHLSIFVDRGTAVHLAMMRCLDCANG